MYRDMRQFDLGQRSVLVIHLDTLHRIQGRVSPIDDLSKNGVFAIKVGLLGVSDEELGLVGVRSRVGHGYHASGVELERGSHFIRECLAPYALTTLSRASRITGLYHETSDVPMKQTSIIIVRSTECKEVFGCLWNCLAKYFYL